MKFSFVCHEFPPIGGGAASALDQFTAALALRGHRIQVITIGLGWKDTVVTEASNREIVRLGTGRRRVLAPSAPQLAASYLALRHGAPAHLERFSPQALVAFFAFPAGHAMRPAARRLGCPLIVSLRGSDVPGFSPARWGLLQTLMPLLVRPVLRQADRVLANGAALGRMAEAFLPGLTWHNLPNGTDRKRFHPGSLDPLETPLRTLFVGQFIRRKRCLEWLDALHRLGQQGIPIRATLVGDGPLYPEVRKKAAALPANITVHLTGSLPREQLPDIYRQHHVLLHLSTAEGVSNVLLEGMASGLAVVASRPAVDPSMLPAVSVVDDPTPDNIALAVARLHADRDLLVSRQRAALHLAPDWEATVEAFLDQVSGLCS
ncbi:MAG: glycosyltransferase [Magnetococcales bacterium]|nr:glycosyltransferase [Magnetococcales bacterium]